MEGYFLCEKCEQNIVLLKEQTCPVCYREGSFEVCNTCSESLFLDGLVATCRYENNPIMQRSIHEFKYNFIEALAGPLGKLMGSCLVREMKKAGLWAADEAFVLCPVPLHKKRMKWRGFNQARLLADLVSGESSLPVAEILERLTFKKPQMELKREERLKNVADAFRAVMNSSGIPQRIVLVDDVATTLSTLNACAKALKSAGAKTVLALVLARAV